MRRKKNNPGKRLYFIAWVLPEPLQRCVTDYKILAKDLFHSRHALNSPAHITLIPPFYAHTHQIEALPEGLRAFTQNFSPIPVSLSGFGKFGKRVIFVDVVPNPELMVFQNQLYHWFTELYGGVIKSNRFHPHATVAFRDLTEEFFDEAWDFFSASECEEEATMNEIHILKHEHRKWHVIESLPLKQKD